MVENASATKLPAANYLHWANFPDKTAIDEGAEEKREKLDAEEERAEEFAAALAQIKAAQKARATRWTRQTQSTIVQDMNGYRHAQLGNLAEEVTGIARKALNTGKYSELLEESAETFVDELKGGKGCVYRRTRASASRKGGNITAKERG